MAACSFGGGSRHVQHYSRKRFGNFNVKDKTKDIYLHLFLPLSWLLKNACAFQVA